MSLLPRDVIGRAMRLIGQVASLGTASADQMADAFLALNSMKRAMFGTLIGPRLSPQNCDAITAIQADNGGEYQIGAVAFTVTAPFNPRPGARFGVVDASNSFSLNPCAIVSADRLIEASASGLTITANGDNRRWWFRPDAGNWVREADFASLTSPIEFPDPLIAYLPYMLAAVIAPEFGAELTPAVIAGASEGREAFARTYARRGRAGYDPPIGLAPVAAPQPQGQGQ
ncbi:MAG: hypothetical protein ACYC8V_06750 [Caulobacteraceae bacterium]